MEVQKQTYDEIIIQTTADEIDDMGGPDLSSSVWDRCRKRNEDYEDHRLYFRFFFKDRVVYGNFYIGFGGEDPIYPREKSKDFEGGLVGKEFFRNHIRPKWNRDQ